MLKRLKELNRGPKNLLKKKNTMVPSINYVDRIMKIFCPLPLRLQVSLLHKHCCHLAHTLPLACQCSLWLALYEKINVS